MKEKKVNESISSFTFEYKEILTTTEAAFYMGKSVSSFFNDVSNGKIPYYKFGRSNRYLKSELRELLLSQPRGVRNDKVQ
ncbi:MAG: helix-turn-helix domain-containing protein [Halobacteriovoraceae bacterium]|nr:helix-turn-helix domain-containing protein [Halobacteriovoraceae bacterium]